MSRIEKGGSRFKPKFAPKKPGPPPTKPPPAPQPVQETSAPAAPAADTSTAANGAAALVEAPVSAPMAPSPPAVEGAAPAVTPVEPAPPAIQRAPSPVAEAPSPIAEAPMNCPPAQPLFREASPAHDEPTTAEANDADIEGAMTLLLAAQGQIPPPEASTSQQTLDGDDLETPHDPSLATESTKPKPPAASQSKGKGRAAPALASQPNKKLRAARSKADKKRLDVDSDDSGYDSEEKKRHAAQKSQRAEAAKRRRVEAATLPSSDESDTMSEEAVVQLSQTGPRKAPAKRRASQIEQETPAAKKKRLSAARKGKGRATEAVDVEPDANAEGEAATSNGKGRTRGTRADSPDSDTPLPPLDMNVFTIADLCGDVKAGRLSKKGLELRQERKSLKQIRKEARQRQKDKIAGRIPDTPVPEATPAPGSDDEGAPTSPPIAPRVDDGVVEEVVEDDEGAPQPPRDDDDEQEEPEDDEEQGFRETNFVPQLVYDAEGNMVIDQDSLERQQRDRSAEIIDEGDVVEERIGESRLNSHTFSKRKHTARWTMKDVENLWEYLSMSGLDYLRIALWFGNYEDPRRPGVVRARRSRQQVKKKLDKLARLDPVRFDNLVYGDGRKPFDHVRYREITGDDAMEEIEDPMKDFWKDLPGQERKNDMTEEEIGEHKAAEAAKVAERAAAAPTTYGSDEEQPAQAPEEEDDIIDETIIEE